MSRFSVKIISVSLFSEDEHIQDFLFLDGCKKISDKVILFESKSIYT